MEVIDLFIYEIKIFVMCYFIIYIFYKIKDIRFEIKNNCFLICGANIIIATISTVIRYYLSSIGSILFLFLGINVIIKFLCNLKEKYSLLAVIISFSICCVTLGISIAIVFLIEQVINTRSKIITLLEIEIFQYLLIYYIFKIRKLKSGLYFLKKTNNVSYINISIISISFIIIYLFSLVGGNIDILTLDFLITFFIFSIIMIIMIYKTIILSYKQFLLEQSLKDYEKTIKEKDEKITRLTNENFKINKLNHEFYNRQKSLELKVEKALENMNFEISEEFDLGDKIIELSKEFTTKVQEIKNNTELPKTNIEEMDDMFSYMQSECKENGIEFLLKINGNINYLINNIIDKAKLVTLVGDHLRDAIIAINYTKNKYKNILAILGIKDDTYEFCIYDSGIEFDIETFNKLGLEPITTHKESGGSGIGFVTTFETLNQINASLIIEEKNELTENKYTKSITFKFDNKRELKIISYRAKKIREKLTNKIFNIEELKNS